MQFNLADLFECVADHVPDHEAVVCGPTRVTYRELDAASNRVAHGLAGLGVTAGDHVGVALRDSVEHVEVMIACYKLRAVPVNVSYRYVADEVAYLCRDAGLVALVSARGQAAATVGAPVAHRVEVDDGSGPHSPGALAYEALRTGASAARDFGPRSGDDRYVLYTGGTTGLPKGVVWRQEDIFFAALGGGNPGGPPIEAPEAIGPGVLANPAGRVAAFLTPDAPKPALVALATGPLIHASGQWSALGTLLSGGAVVLYAEPHLDAASLLDLVARERIVALNLVGDAVARPLVEQLEAHPGRWDTASLLLLGSGGSILSGDVKDRLLAAMPSVAALIDGIGSSESPAQAVAVTTRGGQPTTSLRFTAKATTMVVDDDLRPVPPGEGTVGRLATTGRVPLGYLGDPERSARTFVEIDGARWSLPGDMATIDAEGTVHLLGRGSFCINTGGEKVYPEEVEAALKSHPAVADAVVVGVPDPRWGERVAVLVAPADGVPAGEPTLDALQAYARERLAGYKLPRVLRLVDEVVRLPTGKADYRWAREAALTTPT
ncbi:MAG TPA: AMP-binding protein [Acidimicrobiia bacterium]